MKEDFKKESYLIDYLKLSKKEPVFNVEDFKIDIDLGSICVIGSTREDEDTVRRILYDAINNIK